MAVVRVDAVGKSYGGRAVLDEVSFEVAEGEIFGILGPNGAGKTTLVECVAGLRTPDRGRVTVLDLNPGRERDAVRQVLGVQLQESELPEKLTVREIAELYACFYTRPVEVPPLLEQWGLTECADRRYGRLSGGQQQRLALALAVVGDPRVVVLDELTTGLDPHARRNAWAMVERIRDAGTTVLLVTHVMEEAEHLCDRIAVIDAGRLVALDTPEGLTSKASTDRRLRFRPSEPLDDRLLLDLPEVDQVVHHGTQLEVTGTGNLVHAVTALLARHQVIAHGLRVEQATLDDAFVALTGRPLDR
ncbi:ABC transporter ATP-binding protein [Peterkaempfera griseoplana]|uniref:ABC transporter ATP-binding protein n=1 Tax=Peterkaempfera griseoplana TaxID=66896 RepID=UPI0006E26795|nr:ABC transporter ATP-binding protein [Peterkaempfera griseoplana]